MQVRNAIGRKIQRWREENTLPTKQVSRRGSGQSRNNSWANVFNSTRRGSQHSHSAGEEATTLPFRLPTSGDTPEYHLSNGSRSPPFVRLDEIQPLNNTSPPSSASPTSKSPPPPPYSALFPVKEVDETMEQSEETEQGDTEENQPLRGDEEVHVEADVAKDKPNNHISISTPDVICHAPLTNGPIDTDENGLDNEEVETDVDTLVDSGGGGGCGGGGGGDTKTSCDNKIDQNENKQGPLNNCLHEPIAVTVGGDSHFNENNCNNNAACSSISSRSLPKAPGVGKRVCFEDEDIFHGPSSSSSTSSPKQFCDTGFLTRGVAASALAHSEMATQQPIGAMAGQSIRHDDVTDNRGSKHPNRAESVEKSKQKNCILSDVRQKNSGIVNGSIIFPEAPPGTPV